MKTLHHSDAGFDCEGVIRAESEEDLLSQAGEHAQTMRNTQVAPNWRSS